MIWRICGRLLTEHFECAVSMLRAAVHHTVTHSEPYAAVEMCVLACGEAGLRTGKACLELVRVFIPFVVFTYLWHHLQTAH